MKSAHLTCNNHRQTGEPRIEMGEAGEGQESVLVGSLGDIARVQRHLAVWALEACPISRKDAHARRRFSSGDRASRTGQKGTG
jgi:hypothetical protein